MGAAIRGEAGPLLADICGRFGSGAVASAIADATGMFVSSTHPLGMRPFTDNSESAVIPDPVGSRWTTSQPLSRDETTKVSPLHQNPDQWVGEEISRGEGDVHSDIELVALLCRVGVYSHRV